MTRKHAKKWIKEIKFWANGGTLWWYSPNVGWFEYMGDLLLDNHIYVMGDKHFRARKAFALGKPIQAQHYDGLWSDIVENRVCWDDNIKYRPKPKEWFDDIPKEGILCWVWDSERVPIERSVSIICKNKTVQNIPFESVTGATWRFATPIKPEECYQGAKGDN